MGDCPTCGGTGTHTVTVIGMGCCGDPGLSWECCGDAIPVPKEQQEPCADCGGTGALALATRKTEGA